MTTLRKLSTAPMLPAMGLLALFLFSNAGCSSYFKRKECEATNWFEYGNKVALEGRRLTGDKFIDECHKAEAEFNEVELDRGFKSGMAKYCQPETVFDLGKRGDLFSPEMCDGENPRLLQEKHKAGVSEYCRKSNGYTAGAAGKAYNRICPKNLEGDFLPEFRRGRKKYLSVLIIENERRINDLDRDILNVERERNMKSLEAQRLQIPTGAVVERKYDPMTGTVREQVVSQVSEEQKRRADDIRWQIQNLDSRIHSLRSEQVTIREKNRESQLEIVSLDDRPTE